MAQAALQFCLTPKAVSTCIPGAKNREQAIANAHASDFGALTDEDIDRINSLI